MRRRALGRSGIEVSVLALGTMTFGWSADEEASFAIMSEALDRGIDFFDTADIYSRWSDRSHAGKSEEIIGRWLAEDPSRRNRIVLATKVRGPMSEDPADQGLRREHVTKSVEGSLRRLRTDRIDLYQSHWWDPDAPQEETLRAYEELVRAGKVRAIGCSNFEATQIEEGLAISARLGGPRYESVQPHYNLLERRFEKSVRALCLHEGLGVIPYSPLAGGFLTGKYRRGAEAPPGSRGAHSQRIGAYLADDRAWDLIDRLDHLAHKNHATIAQIALSWLLSAPSVTSAIIGANDVAQLRDLLPAAEIELGTEDFAILDTATAFAI
jgi:aryl-alcohol dehydrogenase-like predicted oxidoreductase